jgi:hypothetical protein
MVAKKGARKSKARKTAKKKTSKAKARKTAKKKTSKTKARKTPAKAKAHKTSPEPNMAMRLTFSYDGDDVKLVSQQRTEMIVPPSDPLKGYAKHKGFWAEVKNGSDKTLYRTVMHNPTKNDAEVFPDSPGGFISRQPAPKRKGVFVVVVPDMDKGEEVTLSRSAPDTEGPTMGISALATEPAAEILRVKLKK